MIVSSVPVDLTIARQIEVFYFIFMKETNNFFIFLIFFTKILMQVFMIMYGGSSGLLSVILGDISVDK